MRAMWDGDKDLWAKVVGTQDELNWMKSLLSDRAGAMNPKADTSRPVFVQKPDALYVLRGWISQLQIDGLVNVSDAVVRDREAKEQLVAMAAKLAKYLRPAQATAAIKLFCAPFECGTVQMATGTGKTRLCAGIMALGSAIGAKSWLYLVTNQELAAQSRSEFDVSVKEMCDVLECPMPEIACMNYGGLSELEKKQFDGVIVDEAHGLPAATRAAAYSEIEARYRFGMSGSLLLRQDENNALVVGLLGPMVYEYLIEEAQEEGSLARGCVVPLIFRHLQSH
jgi:superfamily II DNA or RNA helicase